MEPVRYGRAWNQPVTTYRCNHCHLTWTHRAAWPTPTGAPTSAPPATSPVLPRQAAGSTNGNGRPVIYQPVRCPKCGSAETTIRSSPKRLIEGKRIRHHGCRQCKHRFKSVEAVGSEQ